MIKNHDVPLSSGRSPWFVLVVMLLTGLAGTINYYKVPPLLPSLMASFHLAGARAGLLMSVFAVVGILFSIPAGIVITKLGYRLSGIVAVISISIGSVTGALSSTAAAMLAGRFMEGIGFNLLALTGPTIVAVYFSGRKRATAIGIWNASYPLGSTVSFTAVPFMAVWWGWRSAWWFGASYALAVGVLYYVVVRADAAKTEIAPHDKDASPPLGATADFRNRDVWILSIMFFCFAFVYVAYFTWTPTFLHVMRGMSLSSASLVLVLFSVLALLSSPLSGWILTKTASPRLLCASVIALYSAIGGSVVVLDVWAVLPLQIVMGLIASFLPVAILTMVARMINEKKATTFAVSMITIGQNVGIFFGPTVFGYLLGPADRWHAAYAVFIPVGLIGIIASLLLKRQST
jgi:predicted MFS family arabinose efflux permease